MNKFTFKTTQPTGRYRAFENPYHQIKLKGKICGSITHTRPFKIGFMIIKKNIMEDGNKDCIWKWVWLKKESKNLQEAKDFINEKFEEINVGYNIYCHE